MPSNALAGSIWARSNALAASIGLPTRDLAAEQHADRLGLHTNTRSGAQQHAGRALVCSIWLTLGSNGLLKWPAGWAFATKAPTLSLSTFLPRVAWLVRSASDPHASSLVYYIAYINIFTT